MHTSLRDALAALYSRFDADQLVERYSAAAKLVAEEERRRVRQVGDRVPPFNLTHPERGYISSSDLLDEGPLIVSFYRGLWCSYCQRDLLGVEEAFPKSAESTVRSSPSLTECPVKYAPRSNTRRISASQSLMIQMA